MTPPRRPPRHSNKLIGGIALGIAVCGGLFPLWYSKVKKVRQHCTQGERKLSVGAACAWGVVNSVQLPACTAFKLCGPCTSPTSPFVPE